MDFVHNPYRCGPLRVGRYAIWAEVVNRCTASMGLQMGYMG